MLWKDMNQSSIASYLVLPAGGCLHKIKVIPGSLSVISVAFRLLGMTKQRFAHHYWLLVVFASQADIGESIYHKNVFTLNITNMPV